MKKILFTISLTIFIFWGAYRAEAAVLYMAPKSGELKIGQVFNLEIKVNSEGQGFNAAQATIQFPPDVLEVKSIDSSPSSTIFNFWLDGPSFDNKTGKINFIGGATNGISGNSIPILNIVFVAKGAGAAGIVFSDAAVTASDGSGTNILSTMEIAQLTVSPTVVAAPTAELVAPKRILSAPTPIIRTPIKAKILPEKPKVSVSLYPDEEMWYNITTDFLVSWDLPPDVSDVNTAIDRNFSYINQKSEGLFKSKVFPAITEDGVYYLHVRFKNSIGWGPVANYRIGIDTRPPQPFEIDALNGLKTDNPSPILRFKTNDGLSGLKNYLIWIDSGEPIALLPDANEFKLPLQPPGKRQILIKATDKAGNSTESGIELEILPIQPPTFSLVTDNLFLGEGGLQASGTALPGFSVLINLKQPPDKLILTDKALADKNGNWSVNFDQPLKKGKYILEITARDDRGALSLPVISGIIRVRERPLFTLSGIEVTQFWFFSGLILMLLMGIGVGWASYCLWLGRMEEREVIAQRDISNSFSEIEKDLNIVTNVLNSSKTTVKEETEINFRIKTIKDRLKSVQKFIIENVKEIIE